ncbi:MAG: hypothetical protein MUP16_03770 [Sedimentisphaerales bacterium]|nr:hypothetical protein [Sedimentisphaerales bacterium]
MFISYGNLIRIVLFALGVSWCCTVIGRWREDLKELREVEETARKAGIIIVWAITVVIAIAVTWSAFIVLARISRTSTP